MSDVASKPTLLTIGQAHAVARFRNVLATVWRDESSVKAAEDIGEQYRRAMTGAGERFAIVVVIEAQTPLPGDDVRRTVLEVMERHASSIACMTAVLEVSGLRGAAMRSVLAALSLASRAPYLTKICATVTEAAEWISTETPCKEGPPLTADSIESFITAFRAAIKGRTKASEVKL